MIPISFVTAGLAAGAALAAIPVIIHLVMRQTPKRVIFPALRLIKERQKRSHKRLRIRNWLLLAARALLIALMALALARPRLYSQTALGDREVPTALAFVFDTSLSMGYTERGKDRLAEAKEYALEILKKTHEASQVFVLDSSEAVRPDPLSIAAARKRIEGLALHPVAMPLNVSVSLAYKVVVAAEKDRREVYVLTDLARSAWDVAHPVDGLDQAKAAKPEVATYLLRLTPKEARDAAIVEAEVRSAAGVATAGGMLEVHAKVRASGPAARRSVEFFLATPDDPAGKKRFESSVALPANGEAEVAFRTPILGEGLHRASLKLGGGTDPLAFDDTRYLTFRVRPPIRVLLVADVAEDSLYVKEALSPDALPADEPRAYQVDRVAMANLPEALQKTPLNQYACVYLLNVGRVEGDIWGRLDGYVRNGGGLVIALGDRCQLDSYTTDLVPATLEKAKHLLATKPTSFGAADFAHPIFSRDPKPLDADLTGVPISAYVPATPPKEGGVRVLLKFQDGAPALIEKTFPGQATGHVLLWTTPLARRADRRDRAAWNEFPLFWSFLELNDQTVPYLAGAAAERLTYDAGESVSLPLDPSRRAQGGYTVEAPDKATAGRYEPPANASALVIEAPQALGQWSVLPGGTAAGASPPGFSVNFPPGEALLTPLDEKDLVGLFGAKDRYQLADSPETLQRAVKQTRIGHELFPWLMALILALVTAENYLANRFYRERPAAVAVARA
ncbi:MAG TPA: BatA domain-containing protein [Isosphaeraceae bacterium]|jgi:hypothetical protein|nr:BatA domain-containing protein [Isosphaeraceae bacterium]